MNIVLVHGGWHGAWCWRDVIPLLREAGHAVFAPTLTGLADRQHLLSKEVNLTTHVVDVIELIRFEELTDVILVAMAAWLSGPSPTACRRPSQGSSITTPSSPRTGCPCSI